MQQSTDMDAAWMEEAIKEAEKAPVHGDVPIGCVIVKDGEVIARAHNRREADTDPTAHAEVLALRQAAEKIGAWRLSGCTVVVTCEPCAMCSGALVLARVDRLVFGCDDPKAGASRSLYRIPEDDRLNHQVAIYGGILAETCGNLWRAFFTKQRP
ncbi:MAG: tRNA adenosine(34) deaminase TadA [Leptospirillia bacterium]